jgi:dGTPase
VMAESARTPAETEVAEPIFEGRTGRASGGNSLSGKDRRTESERDRGRLSYSPYVRRLAGVTQVVSPELTSSKLHSRASHTYKVAMISREIAEALERRAESDDELAQGIERAGGLDVAACEAAGLAHDLGHPPFGHAGESELNRLLRAKGLREGFEGNAQSFRIVCSLDWHNYERGLDLTNVVLAAILKYPWVRPVDKDAADFNEQTKFGAYESEIDHLKRARRGVLPHIDDKALLDEGKPVPQTLEASIMDLADDIAYSIHDLEDFCTQGFIDLPAALDGLAFYERNPRDLENTFARSTTKLSEFSADIFDPVEHVSAAKRVGERLGLWAAPVLRENFRDQQIRGDLSQQIGNFFDAIVLKDIGGVTAVSLKSPEWHEMQILKQVTKHYLVSTSQMGHIQRAQRKTIQRLFEGIADWLAQAEVGSSLPDELAKFIGLQGLALPENGKLLHGHYRAIADYICTLSDSEAFLRAQWVTGTEIPGMANLGLVE